MTVERRAAIDIGTVTARLLVADVDGDRVSEVVRRQAITHLGAGWTTSGVLGEDGMAAVAGAVRGFHDEARSLGATRIAAVATSASRDAANGPAFLDRVEREAGIRPEIIAGEREAYLTFLGATYGTCADRLLVVDIGGGSTELIVGGACGEDGRHAVDIEIARSIDVGSRRVTERFLHGDPPAARELADASAWVAGELRPFFAAVRDKPREIIAVAGTATSLAAIDMKLDPYDAERVHGSRLSGPSLLDILEHLAGLTLEKRRLVVGLEPERAGVIVGGAIVLQAVLAYAGLSSTLVSEHDILYGMVLDLGERVG